MVILVKDYKNRMKHEHEKRLTCPANWCLVKNQIIKVRAHYDYKEGVIVHDRKYELVAR